MRSRLGFMRHRMAAGLDKNGTPVLLRWQTVTGGSVDPSTGATVGGTRVEASGVARGWVHFVGASSTIRQYAEIGKGDVILEIDPDTDLAHQALRFEIGGKTYVQKEVSSELTEIWDAMVEDKKFERSLLLRLAT